MTAGAIASLRCAARRLGLGVSDRGPAIRGRGAEFFHPFSHESRALGGECAKGSCRGVTFTTARLELTRERFRPSV